MIHFALNLKYMLTTAYGAVRNSGFVSLPSERTLSDYTHWSSAHTGVQLEFIEHFQEMLEAEMKVCEQQVCAISMDEMKIKSGLVFSKRSGGLVGFVDLGDVNRDIERLAADDADPSTDHMLVFMARAVFQPLLSFPIAHFPSLNITGEFNLYASTYYLSLLTKPYFVHVYLHYRGETVPISLGSDLELYNIQVVSLTSDGAKPNR